MRLLSHRGRFSDRHGGELVPWRASNDWDGDIFPPIRHFCRKYPWTVACLLIILGMVVGFVRVDQISDEQKEVTQQQELDRLQRRAENLQRDKQFCRAIPNSTVAGAQALVNILEAQNRQEGASETEIAQLRALGRLYTGEARRLALEELPECPAILVTRPPTIP